jgi:hypothetical protein
LTDLSDKLRTVRKYTGDRFGVARGYDARKKMSRARTRTINKYYEMIVGLTDRPHKIFIPKKGQKRETFAYTGQIHAPKFVKAIVVVPNAEDKFTFSINKDMPKGSRFVVQNRRTKERSWHIPASVFLDENEQLYDENEDIEAAFFEAVLEEYAERGDNLVYMIEANEHHMWGAAGGIPTVAAKLSDLFKQYSAGVFDARDKNSHFIGNWFRGVQVFGHDEGVNYQMERAQHTSDKIDEFNARAGVVVKRWGEHHRLLKSGDIGIFIQGKLVQVVKVQPYRPPLPPRRRQ